MCELDGAWGSYRSFGVLKSGGLHLVVNVVVLLPVDGVDFPETDKRQSSAKRRTHYT